MIGSTFFFKIFTIERIKVPAIHSRTNGEGSHIFDFILCQIIVKILIDFAAVEVIGRNGEVSGEEKIFKFGGGKMAVVGCS